MTAPWLFANTQIFVRDIVRDYCRVCVAVREQQERFACSGTVSYAVLRDLLGEAVRKGVFWRLKDTAHQLFRMPSTNEDAMTGILLWQYSSEKAPGGLVRQEEAEALLDWCIGYAFHECVKLKEDAFQNQHYANRLMQMEGQLGEERCHLHNLRPLLRQTRESIERELARILHVLHQGMELLTSYLKSHGDNRHLARFLVTEAALVRQSFGPRLEGLLSALYGEDRLRPYLLAAQACIEGGRWERACAILDDACPHPEPGSEAARLREQAERFGASR